MTAQPLPDRWTSDAGWLLQAMDPVARLVRLVRMDEAAYRAASFLDDRMLQPGLDAQLCSLDQATAEADSIAREDACWIFHIGHVGSTLISRLLGELESVLSIREPRSLRDLLVAGADEQATLARMLRRACSRTFAEGQAALVKATSFVSEQAPMLVSPGRAGLFLYATPRNYIASILAGENSLKELEALHQPRLERLRRRGVELTGLESSQAHQAAAAWACEMTSLEAGADAMPDRRILWADFDAMLADMAGWLGRCASHFGFPASREELETLSSGPLMRRYSKALEYDYSPSLRAELLAEATRHHRADIESAIAVLVEASARVPSLRTALERAGRES